MRQLDAMVEQARNIAFLLDLFDDQLDAGRVEALLCDIRESIDRARDPAVPLLRKGP